jgi:hypothetical protein
LAPALHSWRETDDLIIKEYAGMTKEKMIEILKRVLNTDADLNFLLKLEKTELETLVACVRDRVEQFS